MLIARVGCVKLRHISKRVRRSLGAWSLGRRVGRFFLRTLPVYAHAQNNNCVISAKTRPPTHNYCSPRVRAIMEGLGSASGAIYITRAWLSSLPTIALLPLLLPPVRLPFPSPAEPREASLSPRHARAECASAKAHV